MKGGLWMGIGSAVLLHAIALLFGGALFLDDEEDHGTLQVVELLTEAEVEDEEEEDDKQQAETDEELQDEEEEVPDAAEVLRELQLSAAASAPALDAASLSAIEQALRGGGAGSGDFASALSFASGGRIGGMGRAGALDEQLDAAFSLAEIDQKPRAVFKAAPLFPSEMRGKKVEGVVTLTFVVDAAGKVTNPRVMKASHPAFEKPALDAIKQWKFEAGVKGGQRVDSKMRQSIRFQAS